ncbi:hypothetical protein [Sphingomicrobium aestuariivivum]|nr:hypothetical protein [Sphingomicrobium aestuariivivum]MCJ8190196.1 hypothetical protein [Sphingomicrobium aestuariivivum]
MTEEARRKGIEIDLSTRPLRKVLVALAVIAALFGAGYAVGALLATVL